MAFSGGVFSRLYSFVTDRDDGIKIRADRMDAELDGIATGLSTAILKDGSQTVTADIPLNNNKLTGVADPTAAQDGATKNYVDTRFADNVFNVYDNTDNTKIVALQVSGVTTGTTRTYTCPDSDGTLLLQETLATYIDGRADLGSSLDLTADKIAVVDDTDTALKTVGVDDVLALMASYLNGRADIGGSLDNANDELLVRDATDGALKKINPEDISGGGGVDVQAFTASGTWNKPSSGTFAEVWCIGGGGGGGSGRVGAAATERSGGGGGGSGGVSRRVMLLSDLSSTETVTIGAGGSGGAIQTTDDTNGNDAADGGDTTFGSHVFAGGGSGGSGGATTSGLQGGNGSGNMGRRSGDGTRGDGNGAPPDVDQTGYYEELDGGGERYMVGGGGGGGGISSGDVEVQGADTRYYSFTTDSSQTTIAGGLGGGNPGSNGVQIDALMSCGGSGAGGNKSGNGAAGGNGGRGSGGGGGSGVLNSFDSGVGGDGGDGYCIVIVY